MFSKKFPCSDRVYLLKRDTALANECWSDGLYNISNTPVLQLY